MIGKAKKSCNWLPSVINWLIVIFYWLLIWLFSSMIKISLFSTSTLCRNYIFSSDNLLTSGTNLREVDKPAQDADPAAIPKISKRKPKIQKPKNHTCEECPFKAHKADILRTHIDKVHRKIKNFHCPNCNLSTYDNSTLQHHINAVHLRIKRYI